MINSFYDLDPSSFAELHFGEVIFSDLRRRERLQHIAEAMARSPGASVPRLFAHPYDTKAAYTFFDHPEAEPETIQAAHRDLVAEVMHSRGTFVLPEDTTEMSFSGRAEIKGLGPVGNSNTGTQGFLLHTVLCVRWPESLDVSAEERRPGVELIGICEQQYDLRHPRPKGELRSDSQARKRRPRESQVWERASERIGRAPADECRWVRVCDAGADIYEHLRSCQQLGHGFVIRSGQDRVLVEADGRTRTGRLYETVRALGSCGEFEIDLGARPGQAARRARLSVGFSRVGIRAPQRPGVKAGTLPAIECWAVRVWEAEPPEGVEGVEWVLLCDAAIESFEQARECALQYATRWLVEEFHKALKSGMGAERLQFETAERLYAAIAVMSVVAMRLLALRERARVKPEASVAEAGLSEIELEVLESIAPRRLRTVVEVIKALGRLGGHLNRRRDGLPGWQTLWHGRAKLQLLVEGYRLGRETNKFG